MTGTAPNLMIDGGAGAVCIRVFVGYSGGKTGQII